MKRLFIQFNAAILMMLAFSFHCQGADKYTLKYNLEKGKTYKQQMVTEMNMSMNAMGQDIKVDMKMEMNVNYDVKDRNNDVYDVQMSYQKMKMSMTNPVPMTIDSDSQESSENKAADVFKSFVGVPLDIQSP
jgi:hypothetical protein